jgi:hypothetical protein
MAAGLAIPSHAAPPPDPAVVKSALIKAVEFFHRQVSTHGGYVYRVSSDLKLRDAEGIPGPATIWIQPPGTPAVGAAFLDAHEATGDPICARPALDAGLALTRTQLQSGGWYYSGHFDAANRGIWYYRLNSEGKAVSDPTPESERSRPAGWHLTRETTYRGKNETIFDDNVTQSALRFLIRLDAAGGGRNPEVRDAVSHGLTALLNSQYPAGGWSASFDRFPATPPAESQYPLLRASYPQSWPREWPKDFRGCYVTNDELMSRCVTTLLLAHRVYGATDPRPLAALKKAGDFLIRAQMPDPQPAWAQQYDDRMVPCWSRAFEPPAISSRESEEILRSLMEISAATDDARFLEPIPRALAYLKKSELSGGKLARFYELETNRPLYFERGKGGKGFVMTYDDSKVSSNYGWINDSRLATIAAEYEWAKAGRKPDATSAAPVSADAVVAILAAQDARGAWPARGGIMRDAEGKKVEPPGGVIESATFIANVEALVAYLKMHR